MSNNETTIRREKNPTGWKVATVLLGIVVAAAVLFVVYWTLNVKTENIAYADSTISLYAGPNKTYASEEQIEGYFAYESEENGWLILERENSEGEPVIRWVDTKDLTTWGQYCYSSSTKVAKSTTE